MEDYNRSHRYRDDNRSSSNERNYGNNWDRTYNRSDDWGGYNTENRDTQYSDRERGYSSGGDQMNRNYYNDKFSNRGSYNTNDYNRNYMNDNYMNDYNRWNNYNDYNRNNFRGDSYNRNDYMRSNQYDRDSNWNNDYNNRYKNEGWRDNYNNNREEDRNWWDKTKDEVASWFGDDDAQRRRNRDDRYNGEHRGKGPKNYTRSQDRIKEDVSDKLSDDSFLDASDIDVEVNGNEVTLNGHVDSRYSKHRAEDLAEDVTGVTHVQNNLRVWNNTTQTSNNNMNTNTQNTSANTSSNANTTSGTGYNTTKNKKDHVTL